jgi:hypothetical protein
MVAGLRLALAVVSVALAAAWRAEALVLLLLLPVVGPLAREIAPGADLDERQRLEDYRASHLALIAVFVLLFAGAAKALLVDGGGLPNEVLLVFSVPLLLRVGMSLGRGAGGRRAGSVIGFCTGAVWLAFTLLSHGLTAVSLTELPVGGSIVVATFAARRWPTAGGAALVIVGAVMLTLVVGPTWSRVGWMQALAMAAALAVPPIVAGLAFLAASRRTPGSGDEFADLRGRAHA